MCDALYFNPPANFKQLCYPSEKENLVKSIINVNNVILNKVKVKSINDVVLTSGYTNNLNGGVIRLGAVYVYDDTNDKILTTLFLKEKLNNYKVIWK